MRPAALLAVALVLAALAPAMAGHAQTPSADLAVTHVGWDQLVDGEDTTFNATIRNEGTASYDDDSFDVRLHLEDDDFDENVTVELEEPVEPGGSRNVVATEPWEASFGNYTINATVEDDSGIRLGGGFDENDYRNRSFELGPDIVTHEVRVDPSSPIAEQDVTFSAEIENVASDDYDVDDPFIVSFSVVDEDDDTVATIESKPLDELRAKDPQQVTARSDWQAEAGAYTVVATADPDGNITETDPGNNTAERAFSVNPAEPDLVVTDVAPADSGVQAGESTPLVATIENEGTDDVTGDFPVRFRVNGTTHGPDIHVQVGDGLQPGATTTAESEAWLASEGHHELVAIADPGNQNVTDESNLANNELATDLHVGPDLVVDDIVWTPDPPAAGYEVAIEPVVRNQGTADVTQNTTVEVRIPSEGESWRAEVGPLGAGNATQVHAADWTPPEDDASDYPYEVGIEAEADVDDEADEVDDTNNVDGETMEVTQPLPDIVTVEMELDPPSPGTGEETNIEAAIRNNGSADAQEVEVQFLVDGDQLGEVKTIAGGQFASLPADGGTASVTSDAWDPSLGEHEITVHPYLPDDAPEVREDNNNATREVLVGPDALVEDIELTPAEPEAEDEVTFEATVANAGSEPIDEMRVAFEVDGEPVGNQTVSSLDAGENETVDVGWTAEEGDHKVRVVVDADDEVIEAREGNNEGEQSFSTTASPDIQPTSIRWSEEPRAGDKLVFTATVANTGTAGVEGAFEVTFHVGDEAIGTATIDGLAQGNTKSVSSDAWTASAGTHTARVVVDAGDDVTEGQEANNERTSLVTVDEQDTSEDPQEGPPNLVVSGLSAPDDVQLGDEVTFLATIENEGGQAASASQVRFLVDGDVFGEPSLDRLEPGQSQSVTSDTWNATRGEHAITAIADVHDDVSESDEDDNERITRIEIGTTDEDTPDGEARISLGAIDVGEPVAGEPVRPTVQVTNDGEAAREVTVTFYVDGTRLGQATLDDLGPGEQAELRGPVWEPTEGEHTITAEAGDERSETVVDVAPPPDTPALPLALLLASLVAASLVRRR